MDPVRNAIAGERRRVADLIESLTPAQLDTPSLCGAWTVRQVAGHLLAAVETPPRATLSAMIRGRFRLHRANALLAAEVARQPPAALAAGLRRHASAGFRPPIVGYLGQLTDLQVHGQDMRRPLGLPHGLSLDHLRRSLDFLTGGRAVGFTPRRRLTGLRFEATDLDWAYGTGALVTGPAEALMMALTGRRAVLGELDGPGVRVLAARIP
ncbi:maleylpyruvate isomerase family mycothiol-dependent enzyme [Actinoplanes sp. M2I2]|uniref:maleylpyruvate isomerase family mycothiol-dependent enzyme n=1 Tax=Actinoplanes sp. M2I2 TaxID=1734444 RepID=UPI002021512A|nr:maleylpyruvate isomerase family mycothiol-dependent enzyme [Actinoplanes sp. M2I2]